MFTGEAFVRWRKPGQSRAFSLKNQPRLHLIYLEKKPGMDDRAIAAESGTL
jgi:hypothetical protein